MARGRKPKMEVLSETGVTVIEMDFLPNQTATLAPDCVSGATTEPVGTAVAKAEPTPPPSSLPAHTPLGGSVVDRF